MLVLVLLGPRRLVGSAGEAGSTQSAIDQELPFRLICASWAYEPIRSSWERIMGWPGETSRVIILLRLLWRRKIQKMLMILCTVQERSTEQLGGAFLFFCIFAGIASQSFLGGKKAWEREKQKFWSSSCFSLSGDREGHGGRSCLLLQLNRQHGKDFSMDYDYVCSASGLWCQSVLAWCQRRQGLANP